MNRDRLLTFGIIGAVIVVAVLGWMVGVSPILSQAASADEERSSVTSINDVDATKLITLKKQFENIAETQASLDSLRASVPADADMSVFLRTIKSYGDANGIKLTSVEVSGVQAYVAPVAAVPVAAAGTTPAATPTPSATPAPTATPAAATPIVPASNLQVIPIKISVTGTYAQVMAFTGAMQTGPRLFLISNLDLSSVDNVFVGDLSGDVYALPAPAVPAAAVAPSK